MGIGLEMETESRKIKEPTEYYSLKRTNVVSSFVGDSRTSGVVLGAG